MQQPAQQVREKSKTHLPSASYVFWSLCTVMDNWQRKGAFLATIVNDSKQVKPVQIVCCCCFWKNPVLRQGLCYSYWSERSTLTAKIDLSPVIYCSVMLWYSLRLEIQYSHRTKKQSHDFGALVYFCSPTCGLNFLFPFYLFLGCMLCSRSSVGCFPLVLCPWLLHRR